MLRADETQDVVTVYNLTVEGVHAFFVAPPGTDSDAAVLVHNVDCDASAWKLQKKIGGEIKSIRPKGIPGSDRELLLGQFELAPTYDWFHHTVVVKEGRVYDEFTGPAGMAIDEWKSKRAYPDALDFGF